MYSLTENLFQLFSINLEVRLKYADFIIHALCIKISMQQSKTFRTKAIIVGNGYSAATSIANTVNRLLDHQLYDSIDLSPDIPEEAFAQRIRSITESADQRDLIVLVDTDRFVEQKIAISEQFTGSVFILRNITTQFALEVGRAIMQDLSAEEIFGSLSNHHHLKYNLYHSYGVPFFNSNGVNLFLTMSKTVRNIGWKKTGWVWLIAVYQVILMVWHHMNRVGTDKLAEWMNTSPLTLSEINNEKVD